jgi:hypothetical protein
MGMQLWLGFARCWAEDSDTGGITARQLAGAVSDALEYHHAATIGTTFVARAYAPDLDGMSRDPATKRPFFDVRVEFYAGAEAVPA